MRLLEEGDKMRKLLDIVPTFLAFIAYGTWRSGDRTALNPLQGFECDVRGRC
jgi:hypothetical protein